MKYRVIYIGFIISVIILISQSCQNQNGNYKIGFEAVMGNTNLPQYWSVSDEDSNYNVYADSSYSFKGSRSLLIECKNKGVSADRFAAGVLSVPVDFKGSKIILSGYIKTESVENGIVGLFMGVEGDAGWVMVENMFSEKVQGTHDWKRYEISLPLKTGARQIYLGAYSTGSGKVWIDDLEMLVDGKAPGAEGRISVAPAWSDTSFLNTSGVMIDSLTSNQIVDLVVLGKVWGFLKYYHPAVATGLYNWDTQLFRILPKILAAGSRANRNSILLKWVKSIGTYQTNVRSIIFDSTTATILPDLNWLSDRQELGDTLSQELEAVRLSLPNAKHFHFERGVDGRSVFLNEPHYSWLRFPDDGYQLLSLYRYWNIVQYYYPYKHLIGENWTDVLKRLIPQFVNANSSVEYQLSVLKMISSIHDSHAYLAGRASRINRFFGRFVVPAEVRFIEGKATVVSVPNEVGDQLNGLMKGDVISKVNGRTMKEIQDRLEPYIAASNESQRLLGVAYKTLRGNDSIFFVEVARGNRIVPLRVKGNTAEFIYPAFDDRLHSESWKVLPGNVGYIFLGTLNKNDIPKMMNTLLSVPAIVIDLRCYPREVVGDALGKYFVSKKTEFARSSFASIQYPGLFELQAPLKMGGNNLFPYKGKVIVLVNEFTMSRGEFVAMALKAIPNVKIIGSVTAGTDGDVSEFYLPGGLKTRISGIGIYWPNNQETQRRGIIPDIICQPTLIGVQTGKDEVLEFALKYLER